MNKIYKLVWNKVRRCWVAVAEIAKSNTKSPGSTSGILVSMNGGVKRFGGVLMRGGKIAAITTMCLMAGHAYDVTSAVLGMDGTIHKAEAAITWRKIATDNNQTVTGASTSVAGYLPQTNLAHSSSGESTTSYVPQTNITITRATTSVSTANSSQAYYMGYDNATNKLYFNTTNSTSGATEIQLKDKYETADQIVAALAGKAVNVASLAATGSISAATLTTSGNATINGTETVKGAANLNGNTTIGTTAANANLTVNGNETVTGTITSDGKITSKAGMAAGGKITGVTAGTADTDAVNVSQLKGLDDNKANKNASNVSPYAQEWADAIGTGKVAPDDTKLVTGKAVYDALQDPTMEINIKTVTAKTLNGDNVNVNNDLNVAGDTHLHDTYVDGILDVTDTATFHNNVKMDKNLRVDGTSSFGGKGTFDDDLEVMKNFLVHGDSDLQGNAHVGGDLTVDGTSNLHDTNVGGKLDVTGTSHFHDDVTMDKDLRVKGTTHLGFTFVEGNMMVTEGALIGGDAAVGGNFSASDIIANENLLVRGTSDLRGNTTIGTPEENADLLVNGNATVTGDTNLQGNTNIGKDLVVEGTSTLKGDVYMNSNADIGENLHVRGTSQLDGNVTAGSDLRVKGDTFLEGNTDIGKDLHVRGTSQLDGNTTIGTEEAPADLFVTGNINIGKNLTVQGTLDVMNDTHLHKDLWVDGDTNIGGDIFVGGNETVDGDSTIKGNQLIEKNLTVNGDTNIKGNTTIQQDLTVYGDTNIKGSQLIEKNLTVNGDTNIGGNTIIQQDLTVYGDSNIKGNQLMEKNLTVNGDTNIKGNGRVDQDFSVGGNVDFGGNAHVRKDLRVDGNANIGGTLVADQVIAGGKDMNDEIDRLDGRIDRVGAQSAALAGLRPVDADADQLWSMSASYGNYKGKNAGAVGLFYRPTEKVLVGVGGTVGDSDNMFNASVSFALNKGKNYGMTKSAMVKKLAAQDKKIADMEQAMMAMAQKLGSLSLVEGKTAGFPDVPKDHWANRAVETLHGNNLVQGYPDGMFKGDRPMTRYEYAEMLYNALSNGANVKREHVRQYAPELKQIAKKTGDKKMQRFISTVSPEEDVRMQAAGLAYNQRTQNRP